jgi:MFS family permease
MGGIGQGSKSGNPRGSHDDERHAPNAVEAPNPAHPAHTDLSSTVTKRPMGALLAASLISILGTAMSQLAIPWLVLTTTGSAARTGLVAFAEMAPYVVLQVLAGPLVDRLGNRRAAIVGDAAAAVAVGAIPLLHAVGHLDLGTLIALVTVAGGVRGVADCAVGALVPATATACRVPLERAAGLYSGASRTGLLLGAPLAGVLVSMTGPPAVVLLDAVTFAVAAILLWAATPAAGRQGRVPAGRKPHVPAGRRSTYRHQLAEGFRFLRSDRLLLGIVAVVAVSNLLDTGLSAVIMPVWVRSHGHSAATLGLIAGFIDLGALAGAGIAAWLGPRLPRWSTYAFGSLLGGAPRFLVLLTTPALGPIVAISTVGGVAGGVLNPIIGAVAYERIPARLQARVLGTVKASAWLGIPFGSLLAGLLAESAGLTTTIAIAGVSYLVVTLMPFIFPAWRGLQRQPPEKRQPDDHQQPQRQQLSAG